jgi:DNA-binding NarL/FixJ family response regulator
MDGAYRTSHLDWLHASYGLTKKEVEVVSLLLGARSSKQIAHDLNICEPTVAVHRAHIRRKMGVCNTAGILLRIMEGQSERRARPEARI